MTRAELFLKCGELSCGEHAENGIGIKKKNPYMIASYTGSSFSVRTCVLHQSEKYSEMF